MPIDPSTLPDDTTSFEWPQEARGWTDVKFTEYHAEAKSDRVWFNLQFDNGNGKRASMSQNLFPGTQDDGKKKANEITMGKLRQFFVACGLPEAELPAPSPAAIAKALNAYEGEATVEAYLGPDGRGYTEATRFRKAGAA